MLCPNCGTACPEIAKFCIECGTRLPIPEAPVPPEAPEISIPAPDTEPPSQPAPEVPAAVDAPVPPPEQSAPAAPFPPQPCGTPPSEQPPIPRKQGTHWIPIAIMAVLCVIGLTLFFAFPFDSAAQSPSSGSDTPWFYNDSGTLYFYEELYTGSPELTVPETVDGIPVTSLGSWCFAYTSRITTVILPDTLETIEASAFINCTALRGIYLPEGLTYIGADAFYGCVSLESICIPSTTEYIESGAFDGCSSLRYILYNGIHSHWNDLYHDYICMDTQVYCTDGTFIQRQRIP